MQPIATPCNRMQPEPIWQNEPTASHAGAFGCARVHPTARAVDPGLPWLTPVNPGLLPRGIWKNEPTAPATGRYPMRPWCYRMQRPCNAMQPGATGSRDPAKRTHRREPHGFLLSPPNCGNEPSRRDQENRSRLRHVQTN
jgi:hypothetical protein